MMPCSSKIEISHLLKILAEGADGVEVVGCAEKQCRFLDGNVRAEKRIEYARQLLDKIHMSMDRLGMDRGENLTVSQLKNLAEKRAHAVMTLAPSPMKG
jgi:coenzyme F420-reducing hydrogenase delta subunit